MNILERERTRQKLKKAEVAGAVKVHRAHYGRVESGEKRASFECASRIAAVLGGKITALQIIKIGPAPKPRQPGKATAALHARQSVGSVTVKRVSA